MNRLHATSSRLVHSSRIFGVGVCLLATLAGCSNSVHVIRTNIARSSQSGEKPPPKPWPAHPYVVPETAAQTSDAGDAAALPLEDAEEEEIQTAQWRPTAQPVRASAAGSVISGRVIDTSGRPQGFVSIVASPLRRPGGSRIETMTDSQGNFVLRGLESGQRYLILASATRSPVALIGRVSVDAPAQGITIGLSRPYTSDRQAPPATDRHDPESDYPPPPRTTRDNSNGPNPHAADPFTPAPGASATQRGARPTTPGQTRDGIADNNRMQSPWDMPAPPTQRTPQIPPRDLSTPRTGQPTPPGTGSDWRAAGSKRSEPSTPPKSGSPSLLDAAPPAKSQPVASNGGESRGTNNSRIAPPGNPGGNAFETEADAPPERPRATVTSAKPKSEALNAAPTHASKGPLHPGSMCQMDGHRLVDFQLKNVDGQPVSFQSIDSRLVLIDFWSTTCVPCRKGIPTLMNLQKKYGAQGLQVIGIACEQGPTAERGPRVAKLRNQLHVNYPLLLDEGGDKLLVRDHFGIDVVPTLVLLDRTGKVLWRSEGPDQADFARLENLLKSHLNSSAIRYN